MWVRAFVNTSFLAKKFSKKNLNKTIKIHFLKMQKWLKSPLRLLQGPKLLPMEMPISNFCSWNCYGDSKGRRSEFGIPLPFLTYLPKKGYGIPNSELLQLESPRQFHEQKFGIGISMDRSLGPKCQTYQTR